jgi:hypothetical protein
MPLDARKALHLLQVVTRSFAGRQRTVVVVALASGSYTYTTIQAIMRPMNVVDLQIDDVAGQPAPRASDTLMIAPLGTNFVGAIYIADTTIANASSVASAPKYEIVEVLPTGIVPGGSHLRVSLRRLR